MAVIGLAALTVAGFFGSLFWAFDLTAHFRAHYAAAALVALAVTALGRRGWLALVAAALFVVNGVQLLPLVAWGYEDLLAPSGPSVRMVSFNVNTANIRRDEVVDWLAGADFDVILVLETNRTWVEALEALTPDYRLEAVARPDNFGLALLTRVPAGEAEVLDLGDNGLPSLAIRLETNLGPIALIATHPVPPIGERGTAERDRQLSGLASWARRQVEPVVLLGDLNVTPWSHAFVGLIDGSGLLDSGVGAGYQATWPSWAGPFGIPIDHCLHGRELHTIHRHVGPALGSDHRALIVELVEAP